MVPVKIGPFASTIPPDPVVGCASAVATPVPGAIHVGAETPLNCGMPTPLVNVGVFCPTHAVFAAALVLSPTGRVGTMQFGLFDPQPCAHADAEAQTRNSARRKRRSISSNST